MSYKVKDISKAESRLQEIFDAMDKKLPKLETGSSFDDLVKIIISLVQEGLTLMEEFPIGSPEDKEIFGYIAYDLQNAIELHEATEDSIQEAKSNW